MEFSSNPNLQPLVIDNEAFRQYFFPGGHTFVIENPTHIHVSKSGGHRLLDAQGIAHYVPFGWIHLAWKPKEGKEAFLF